MKEKERTLPANLEAEKAILGAVLVNNAVYERADVMVDDFFRDAHRRIWVALAYLLNEQKVAVDLVTIKNELARRGELDEVGGPAYIASLTDGVPRSANVEYYAGIVAAKAKLRQLIGMANVVLEDAYDDETDAATIIQSADRAIIDLQRTSSAARMVDLRESSARLFDEIHYRVEHQGELTGIDTGFWECQGQPSINDMTSGWQRGDLIVIAARPSIGKSAFVLNTAVAAAKAGQHVGIFSLEMRRAQIERRLLTHLSGVPLTRIKSGYLGDSDFERLSEAMTVLSTLPISINDQSGQTVWDMRRACRRLKSEHGLGMVIIDYVQLMPGSLAAKGATRTQEIDDIALRVKNSIAGDLEVPTLLLSQLNRASDSREDKRPRMSDLRESGALEQHADLIGFLHRKDHKAGGPTAFILDKRRDGECGTLPLLFERDTQTFTAAPPEAVPEPSAEPEAPKRQRRMRY